MQLMLQDRRPPRVKADWIWSRVTLVGAAVGAAVVGLGVGATPVLALVPVAVAVIVLLWHKPHVAIVILLASSTLVENLKTPVGTRKGVLTAYIPWWRSVSHGMILFPVEFFLLLVILIWILKAGLDRSFGIEKSALTNALKVFWVAILVGIGVGLMHGAKIKYNLWETRAWIYLTVGFVLAAALLKTKKALDAVLWTLVLGTGVKGIQGTQIFFAYARNMRPRPEAILGHEEAFFMGLFLIITVALWLYGFKGPLRTTATMFAPFVLIADMANARREAWAVLFLGLAFLVVVALKTLPHRRRVLRWALVVVAIASVGYLPAYWNKDGTLAQPARAVRSQVQPSSRDQASDLYRIQEDWMLTANIQSSGLLGAGFGVPIAYNYSEIANISNIDPMIAYIPHNGLLWIWLRLGLQGEIAFWCLMGVALIRACQLAKTADPRIAMFGTIVGCALIGYLTDGYEDMGLADFRIAMAMGCLLGVMEAARRLAGIDRAVLSEGSDVARPLHSL
jgi:hypothetical protein